MDAALRLEKLRQTLQAAEEAPAWLSQARDIDGEAARKIESTISTLRRDLDRLRALEQPTVDKSMEEAPQPDRFTGEPDADRRTKQHEKKAATQNDATKNANAAAPSKDIDREASARRWEYLVQRHINTGGNVAEMQAELSNAAEEGWELVQVANPAD